MFQKEVAQRIAAPSGSKVYGVTSVLVQAFFDVTYLFDVHEQCFNPPPKVKSGVIRLLPKKSPVEIAGEKQFFLLVKTAFNQREKPCAMPSGVCSCRNWRIVSLIKELNN